MKDFLTKLLEYYDISYNSYLNMIKEPKYESLKDPSFFNGIEEISSYLKRSIDENKKILIYGDYDCDGIMATSIIFNMLNQYKGYVPGFYIPNREIDGYGLNKKNIERFKELNYNIIICVDNGITLVEEIDYLNSLNMECVVIDHHTKEEKLPNAKYILHPIVSNFGTINMSAGGVSFYLSRVFLNRDDDYLATLGMISTLSDLMELKEYNRELVRIGLRNLNNNKYLNIVSLLNNPSTITETDLSMILIPKVNAIGRIALDNSLFDIVRYFTTDSASTILKRVVWIEDINNKRKDLINEAMIGITVDDSMPSIIEKLDIKEGLCGLVANKFLEKYKKPTIIFVDGQKENVLKGSIRSKQGFNVVKAFEELKDLLLSSGGHAQAGGLSIKKEDFEIFKERFNKIASDHQFIKEDKKAIDINLSEINLKNIEIMNTLRPFGMGFNKPIFEIDSFNSSKFTFSRDHKHIITNLNFQSSLVYFNFDSTILTYKNVKLLGFLEINEFNGFRSAQYIVNSFEKN